MASDQLAYAPARPDGDFAGQERDDLRLPRQRANGLTANGTSAALTSPGPLGAPAPAPVPAFAAFASVGAAGLAPAPAAEPAARPARYPLPDAVIGGAPLAGPPSYDPSALTLPAPESAAPAAAGATTLLTRPVAEPAPVEPDEAGTAGPVADEALAARTALDLAPVRDPGPAVADEDPAPTGPEAGPVAEAEPAAPADPGAALCARLLGQVAAQREAVARAEREVVERAEAAQAAREAAERKVREQVAAAKAAAEEKVREEAAAAVRAEAERLARLAASYIKPVACATLGAGFGETDPWANLHNGQDFTAPTGTPVHAVHGGTVTSAGWAGSDGYRVVLTLDDGTELRYCHLSTMVVTDGRVTTGDTIGRVGATGNVPAPHLHLEVRPDGAAPVDPLPWLRAHDVAI
ncbi:putative peptidase [Actinacidiphila reveromycinica]|uniref:Putative peptidase n=1 Tax=Actinacidiphila reveromycinica TaxID=659352 RepID=A0A7U3UT47_9ACTN|nr:M23 family metallopeptidase [Streptomyces sp. SN-593]BBA98148.1 putative peptidase [Streptomyces sp. SN-593]